MNREKMVDYLQQQIDKNSGWHKVKREEVYKIVDGLMPIIKNMIKYPTKKNITTQGGKYYNKIVEEHMGFKLKINAEAAEVDFKEGFKSAVEIFKKMNSHKPNTQGK